MREDKIFDIEFDCEGRHYKGWVNPSDELREDGSPASFHVVLDNVSFGYLSYNNGSWSAHEERPVILVETIGNQIQQHDSSK